MPRFLDIGAIADSSRFLDTGSVALKRRYIDSQPSDGPIITTRPGSHVSRNETTVSSVLRFGTTNLQTVGTLVCSNQSSQQLKWTGIPAGTYCKVDLTWFMSDTLSVLTPNPVTVSIGTKKSMFTLYDIDITNTIFTPSQTTNTYRASWTAIITPTGGEISLIISDFASLIGSTTYGFDAWCLPLEPGIIS